MVTEDIDKILGKTYSELSAAERKTIREFCSSEEEFIQLQQFFASVENYAQETTAQSVPSPKVKESLDDLFHDTYRDKGILWYNAVWAFLYPADKKFYQTPLVRIAAVLILLVSLVPLFNGVKMNKQSLAKNEMTGKQAEKDQSSESAPKLEQEASTDAVSSGNKKEEMAFKSAAEPEVSAVSPVLIAAAEQDHNSRKDKSTYSFGYMAEPSSDYVTLSQKSSRFAEAETAKFEGAVNQDGIYYDTLVNTKLSRFSRNQNLAVLDLLTPTF